MCATGALSVGVNVKNIRWVFHCGQPWQFPAFFQESGRAGRDGEEVNSTIVMSWADYTQLEKEDLSSLPNRSDVRSDDNTAGHPQRTVPSSGPRPPQNATSAYRPSVGQVAQETFPN
jgi:superfamily II DNA helicase RecQ